LNPLRTDIRFGRKAVLAVGHSRYAASRARQLFAGRKDTEVLFAGSGTAGAVRALRAIVRARPRLTYLIDVGISTAVAAPAARLLGSRVVLDTGDLAFALARSTGSRSYLGLAAVWAGERLLLGLSSHVVVRGTAHLSMLADRPASYAPDMAPEHARPAPGDAIRERLGLQGAFVVGLVGSLVRAPRLEISYGWDVIEALPRTSPRVHALIVGDGDGLPQLRLRARQLGVAERCRFPGYVEPEAIAEWIGAMDAGLSTQSGDAVGAVRTTGKLPLYLACGCPVLASDVGEARRLLGPLGWTIPYSGVVDRGYPVRLAERIQRWADDPLGAPRRRRQAIELSRTAFNPDRVRQSVNDVIEPLLR
jgi:glycosyltransferase involved in cell wall biosynthesis